MGSIEVIYDGVKDYIEDNLEPFLDDLRTTEISPPMFKSILRSSVYDILGLKQYPSLMMEYGRIGVERETTTQDRYLIPITLYCISMGGDTDKLQKLSEKYVWALKQMIETDNTMSGLVDDIDIQGFEFSPSLKRANTMVHVGVIYITLDTLINRE